MGHHSDFPEQLEYCEEWSNTLKYLFFVINVINESENMEVANNCKDYKIMSFNTFIRVYPRGFKW